MKEKKWVDCPCCGAKDSMKFKKFYDTVQPKNYPKIEIGPLEGYFCALCDDGFLTFASEKLFDSQTKEAMARYDAKRTPASKLLPVPDVVEILKKSRQWIHKLMDMGKLEYVYVGSMRFPKKEAVMKYKKEMEKKKRKQGDH